MQNWSHQPIDNIISDHIKQFPLKNNYLKITKSNSEEARYWQMPQMRSRTWAEMTSRLILSFALLQSSVNNNKKSLFSKNFVFVLKNKMSKTTEVSFFSLTE